MSGVPYSLYSLFFSLFVRCMDLWQALGCECNNPTKREKKRDYNNKRGGAPKAKEDSMKKLQILTLPPKWPRSGVTFHY